MIRVFLIAGQSNAAGRARFKGRYTMLPERLRTWLEESEPKVDFFYHQEKSDRAFKLGRCVNSTIQETYDEDSPGTIDKEGGHHGPEITFAERLSESFGRVAIIKYAKGGSSLYSDWSASGPGPRYQIFLKTVEAGLSALAEKHPDTELVVSGMLWVQGERDAKAERAVVHESYRDNLEAFIQDVREKLEVPDLPFVVSRLSNMQFKIFRKPGFANVRGAQDDIAANVANVGLIDVDDQCIRDDELHFATGGQQHIGRAAASLLIDMLA